MRPAVPDSNTGHRTRYVGQLHRNTGIVSFQLLSISNQLKKKSPVIILSQKT